MPSVSGLTSTRHVLPSLKSAAIPASFPVASPLVMIGQSEAKSIRTDTGGTPEPEGTAPSTVFTGALSEHPSPTNSAPSVAASRAGCLPNGPAAASPNGSFRMPSASGPVVPGGAPTARRLPNAASNARDSANATRDTNRGAPVSSAEITTSCSKCSIAFIR